MASRKASKKRKRSSLSPHPRRHLLKQATADATVQRYGWTLWDLFFPVQSSLVAVQTLPKPGLPDKCTHAEALRKELVKLGRHVEHLALEPGMTEDDRKSFW